MKNILNYINEGATKKPSDLKKLKDTSKVVDVRFKSGDRYDLSDDGYVDKFKYYSGETDGYITDKEGNVYDVEISKYSSDSGYIAGGTLNWSSRIHYKNDKWIEFKGYEGIFSHPSSKTASTIVSDIKDGMYLEDYVAKHVKDIRPYDEQEKDYIKALIEKGDPNAKTYTGLKADKKNDKRLKLYTENIYLGKDVFFEIKKDSLNVDSNILSYRAFDNVKRKVKRNELNEDEIRNKFIEHINKGMIPMLQKIIGTILKTDNIFEYYGINGCITTNVEKSYSQYLMYNVKKNKFVIVDVDENKIVNDSPELFLEDNVFIYKNNSSEKTLSLFKRASDEFLKLNKRKQGEYIEKNYTKFYSWQDGTVTISKQKAKARDEFKRMIMKHDFEQAENRFDLSWNLLKDFIDDGRITDPETNKPVETTSDSSGKTQNKPSISEKAYKAQEEKMDKWHNGERGQNIKAMSDAKLKINYKICKDKNYTEEVAKLEQEAKNRNLNLNECLSIKEYFSLIND